MADTPVVDQTDNMEVMNIYLEMPLMDTEEPMPPLLSDVDACDQVEMEEDILNWLQRVQSDAEMARMKVNAYMDGYMAGYIGTAVEMLVGTRSELIRYVDLHWRVLCNSMEKMYPTTKKFTVRISAALHYVFSGKFCLVGPKCVYMCPL